MKSLKLVYALFFLVTFNSLHAQSNTANWRSGFTASGCVNAMSAVLLQDNGDRFSNFAPVNSRTWKFQHEAGFSTGFFLRRPLGDKFFVQGEANLLLNRQQAELDEQPPPFTDPRLTFFGLQARKGTVKFSNLYLQIPLILGLTVNGETSIELGLFFTRSMANNSESSLKTTTFSTVSNQTGVITVFNPPTVTQKTTAINVKGGQGFTLGIQHNITDKIGLRLRYEGGFQSGQNEFQDVVENRLLVGVACKLNR